MRKKILLATMGLAGAMMLSGCSAIYGKLPHDQLPYYDTISRAKNLTYPFGYELKDMELPEGYEGESNNLVVDTVLNTGVLTGASGVWGSVPNTFDAIGVGLAWSLADAFFDSLPYREKVDGIFGYVPVEKAQNITEAQEYFVNQAVDAFIAALKDLKVPYKVSKTYNIKDDGFVFTTIAIENEARGCLPFNKQAKAREEYCALDIFTKDEVDEPGMTSPVYGKQYMAWQIKTPKAAAMIEYRLNSAAKDIDINKLMVAMTKRLPKDMFIYRASVKDEATGKYSPNYVVEKGQINFFVKPQQAKTK